MNIGIIGYGTVGKAVYAGFNKKTTLHIYDPRHSPTEAEIFCSSIAEVYKKSQFIFICVPTPQIRSKNTDCGDFDSTIIDSCMEILAGETDTQAIVVIVSTVIPSKVASYLKDYPHLNIVVSPELLTEQNSKQDFLNPECRVIGGATEHTHALQALYEQYSNCQPCKVAYCSAVSAAYIKYMRNAFLAVKVSMMNQFYDLFQKMDNEENWEEIAEILHHDSRLGNSHYHIPGYDGDRGWGGKCFPKDTNALCHYAKSKGVALTVLESAIEYNKKIRKKID